MALAFTTVAALRNRLQDPNLDAGVAQQAIDDAVGLIRDLSGQTLDFVAQETTELDGGRRELVLPQRPVVVDDANPLYVAELDVHGHPWPSTEGQFWFRRDDKLIRQWPTQWNPMMQVPWVREQTRLWAPMRPPGVWSARVQVRYSHGYQAEWQLPPGLGSIVLAVAAQYVVNPQMLRMEKVGGVELTYGSESMRSHDDLVDGLKKQLKAIRLRRGGAFSVGSC